MVASAMRFPGKENTIMTRFIIIYTRFNVNYMYIYLKCAVASV